jgi:hypothetical protein
MRLSIAAINAEKTESIITPNHDLNHLPRK